LQDLGLKVAFLAGEVLQLRVGKQVYIEMPADLDQLGRDNSHGTFVGGERLVQLSHTAAYGGALFQEVYVIARIGQVQSSLHSGNSTTDHQDRTDSAIT